MGACKRAVANRPVLVAALVYAVLALALVSPALVPGKVLSSSDLLWFNTPWGPTRPAQVQRISNPELYDAALDFQPWLQYTRRELPDVPLWNPHIMGGRPFVANAQSAVFSLFSLPAYVLPFWRSLALIAALKLFVGSLGAFLLGRALGMRFGGSLLAGLAYGFCLYQVTWLSWPHSSVWALIPWLLVLCDRLVRDPGPLPVTGLGALVGAQFLAGHPESSFHALVALVAFFALRLAGARRQGQLPSALRPVLAFGAALVLGTALAALVLVPFAELALRSADLKERGAGGVSPSSLVGMVMPDYFGRPTGTSLGNVFTDRRFQTRAIYVGALPLMLAAAALLLRPAFTRVAVAVFGVLCLAVAFRVPPLFQVVTALPGFSIADNSRLTILFLLCLALLAGWGLDDLVARRPPRDQARLLLGAATLLLCAPLVWLAVGRPPPSSLGPAIKVAWGFATPPPVTESGHVDVIRLAALIVWLTLAGAALALIVLRVRRKLAGGVFVVLCIALVAVDLFRAGMGYNTAIDRDVAVQPTTPAMRLLRSAGPGARFAGVGEFTLPPDVGMRYGLYDARGYDFPVERRYDRLWRRQVAPEIRGQFATWRVLPSVSARRLRALGLFGTGNILDGPAAQPLSHSGLRLTYDGPDALVYRNRLALPRVFVVDRQRVVSSENQALATVTAPNFDGRRVAVTEVPLAGIRRLGPASRARPLAGRAEIKTYEPDRVGVAVDAPRRGLLVLTDLSYPGWKATVDGRPAPVERVDYLLRAVRLPAGARAVVFRYQPLSWRIGWIVSLVALLSLVAVVAVGVRGRRRVRRPAAQGGPAS